MNRKKEALGMDPSTAQGVLKKSIMFDLAKRLGLTTCYQCKEEIENVEDFSIEHRTPWLNSPNPKELFFNLDNIAFSHLSCNCAAADNKFRTRTNSTGYRGVLSPTDRHTKYRASTVIEGRSRIIGSYETAIEAATSYDDKVTEMHGELAITNKKLGLLVGVV